MPTPSGAVAFEQYPARIDPSVYDDAVAHYTAAVSARAGAVYQAGNVRYPGLSDIDLVVVVRRPAWDNNQYFSPFVRLPKGERDLFHHEPRFVPESCLDAIGFSSCVHAASTDAVDLRGSFGSRRRLIWGSDLLGSNAVDVSSTDWQRCRVLEIAFTLHRVVEELERTASVSVVKLMSKATALRYPMRHLHDLLGVSRDNAYEQRIDQARTALLESRSLIGDRRRVAAGVYDLFLNTARRYDVNVRTLFELTPGEPTHAAAAAMLAGARPAPGVDPAYIAARLETTARYNAAQREYRLSTGSIFATKPYNGEYRRYEQPFVHRLASNARWRFALAR